MSLLDKIKELFATAPAAQFKDVKTADGAILRITGDLAEGATAQMLGEDGTLSPATGEYKLDDGTTLSCAEGKISKVAKTEEQPAQMEETPVVETVAQTETVLEANPAPDMNKFNERLDQLELSMKALIEGMTAQKSELSAKKTELTEVKAELAKAKSAPAVNFRKTETKSADAGKSDMQKRIAALAESNQK